VARHIFQACPVWICTQSNITSIRILFVNLAKAKLCNLFTKDLCCLKGEYYRPLFSSPGVAVLVMKDDPSESAKAILNSVLSTWPVLVLTLVMAWLAGIAMWALVRHWNNMLTGII
jgi:ABC-type glycerol-3-phosphate transport system permease component